ncbi:MAG: Ig-like domain-containing protein, partial [Bacteroidales bacterium]|nr:Ig-like domain-containing protein [Bacteroidales bacterium]
AKKSDLDGYALVSQIPAEVDLTDYAKSADIESAYAKKTDLDGYALVSQIPDEVDLTDYALKSELPTVPDVTAFATKTEVSENYLTKETFENYVLGAGQPEAVDLSVYAKSADVNAALANLEAQIPDEVDLTDYALKSEIPDEVDLTDYAKSADIESAYAKKTDLSGYALVSQLPAEVDLSDYAKTENVPTKLSDLNNDVNFVQAGNNISILVNDVEYVKKSYVDSLFTIVFQKCDSLKTVLSNSILLVTSIELQEGSTKTLHVGDTYTMKEPIISEATNRSFTWSIEGEGATITEDGVVTVTGDAGGTFTIVATANDGSGVKGECVVTIIGKAVSKVSLGTGTITMLASESINFMDLLTIEPEGVSYTAIQWSVSGDYGSITQEGVFTADAQAVNNNGYSSYCSVTVKVTSIDNSSKMATRSVAINPDHPGYVASITIPSAITITKGHSYTFKSSEITVLPISANDKTYTWSVLTENAPATISSSGTITLSGSAQDGDIFVVAATANDGSGVRGECTVTVVAPSIAEPNEGAVPALFSVSESKTVYFSQGNLQYQASTGTWRFAENQYDKIGEDNKNASSSYTGWIDLFTWGSSGWKYISATYQPYGTSYPYVDNLTGENKDGDWGVYNAISNGGNQAGMWRTLTKDEWIYLFETRTDASSKYAHAQIDGVNGMILLPDTWELPENISFRSGSGDFSQNTYTVTQWSQLEDAGAVFLPAAGYKNGSTVDTYRGAYWSATAYSG